MCDTLSMNIQKYKEEHYKSINNTEEYWGEQGRLLEWDTMYTQVYNNNFKTSKWYTGGRLNACVNCVDRHVRSNPDKVAIIYTDNDNNITKYTYKDVLVNVCKVATVLQNSGLQKGDCVTIYMPSCPGAVFSTLACARLGIVHNVVFGGYSSDSLLLRINDSKSKFLITTDVVYRAKSRINFMDAVSKVLDQVQLDVLLFDSQMNECSNLDKSGGTIQKDSITMNNITRWSDVRKKDYRFVEPVSCDSEDPLFYLYTSGSTGKPKGMVHTTGGYLVYASLTTKVCFDIKENDVFACTADIGWITGHTYSVYGPLLNGITTVLFGGNPVYPDYYRLYSLVQECKFTQLYTAPTVVRTLRKYFSTTTFDKVFDMSSLRLLGSVGEPINKEAYKWFTESFNNLHIVDTYWQTETGGIIIAPIPGTVLGQPECASLPMFGIDVMILKSSDGTYEADCYELGQVVIKKSWPGIARCVLNDQKRYEQCYFKNSEYYYTGDEGYKDKENLFWIRGRVDDVINVSGHRLSTAELESATCTDSCVAESAVVGIEDEITGQGLYIFAVPKNICTNVDDMKKSIRNTLREKIGKLVIPKDVIIVKGLPKTATGKIMRRVLKDVLNGKMSDDISTCINTDAIDAIRNINFINKI